MAWCDWYKNTREKAVCALGKNSLITERGVIFTPKNIEQFQNLTLVTGPELQQVRVLEIMKGIKTALADQSMELAEFNVNDRWAWNIKLATGLENTVGAQWAIKKITAFFKNVGSV